MAKKALCVGINDYPYDGNDLNGCVNDAHAWADLLVEEFGFPRGDVKLLTDSQAKKSSIVQGIKDLLAGAKSDDVLVFSNSSHGSYVADTNQDEPKYDEVLCPYDIAESAIVDDELRELFSGVAEGVRLTVISDSCFSGTVTRAAERPTPDERRVRFLNPKLRGDPELPDPFAAKPKRPEKYPQSGMKEILLSGANDHEYSYDAKIEGTYNGAMTYYAVKAIREGGTGMTYAQLQERLTTLVDEAGYPQHPQLEGKDENKQRPLFT
jgi:metacaspase-1